MLNGNVTLTTFPYDYVWASVIKDKIQTMRSDFCGHNIYVNKSMMSSFCKK